MTEALLQLDGEGPLHEQIRKVFARKISARELKPGDRLPFEHELTDALNISRMTISRALQALADEGLIVRKRKAGSFVAEQVSHHTPMTIGVPREDIQAAGMTYRYELLSTVGTSAALPGNERGVQAEKMKILHLTCRHLADETPMVMERRWINLEAIPKVSVSVFNDTPPGEWLLSHVAWNEAEHVISAVAADRESALHLEVDEGTACLKLDRRTWSGSATVTHVTLIYPGDRKSFVGRFQPAGLDPEAG